MATLFHDIFSTTALYSQSKPSSNLISQVLPSCCAALYLMHNFFLPTHNHPKTAATIRSCHIFMATKNRHTLCTFR